MNKADFITHALSNPTNRKLLDRMPEMALQDAWLVSGALFQTVWNCLSQRPTDYGIRDYDIVYFDSRDLSWEAENRTIERVRSRLADINDRIEIRNQARVHLWYPEKFGRPYPALGRSTDSIDRYLATVCMVGMNSKGNGNYSVYAPKGLDDISARILRPNPSPNYCDKAFLRKARRWMECWPELTRLAT
ncbi:MAG: nucleotidyltransferase family protein [Rhodospirillales bacterium]|nr:nucleotidyltransferase family protein [Rhodospirillales bacterium]